MYETLELKKKKPRPLGVTKHPLGEGACISAILSNRYHGILECPVQISNQGREEERLRSFIQAKPTAKKKKVVSA